MSNTRELSQLASVISVADETRNIGIGTTTPTSKLHVVGDVRVTGILTVGTSSLTLNGTDNIVLVGSATTIDTTGFKIGGSFLHSSGLNLGSGNLNSHNINSTGIITSTGGFVGNVTGNINSSGVSTVTSLNATNINASGIVTATSGFVGNVTGNLTGNINSSGVSTVTSLVATNINSSGIVTATSGFVGNLTGLASSATQLATGRTVAITGDLTYTSGSFNGTSNVTGTGTLATVNSNVGSFGSQTLIPVVTVNAKGLVTAVTTAAVGTALTVTGDSGSENIDLLTESLTISGGTNLTSSAASNTVTVNLDPNISLTSVVASGVITATSGFVGNLTGEVNANAFDTNASGVVVTGVTTSTSGFVGNVVGVATGLLFGNSSIFIANESIKFVVNNSLIATISTTSIFSVVDLNMGLKNITNLAEPSAASDASTKNYADTGSSDFPIGDYGGFTSGDTDSFGQVISDFTSYDLLNNPSGSILTEDFGVLT